MAPEYVVRTDRAAVNRLHSKLVGLHVVLTIFIVAIMVALGWLARGIDLPLFTLAPFVILLLGETFQLSYHCYLWGSRVAIPAPLVITPTGVVFELPQGRVEVDWPAITAVRVRPTFFRPVLVVDLHPAAVLGAPGVRAQVKPAYWERLRRRGIMLGSVGIDRTLPEVLQVVGSMTGGRLGAPAPVPTPQGVVPGAAPAAAHPGPVTDR